ncbi:hypothetical protein [Amycolatopsis sp. 195334CR]|uniref:hypothetical protein n=1 Tax=Amycolatopsis sp. 195334CR TaxID=2814588 RepID=UPI001A8F0842|nr:hypothetical protein [Amycolatopsis sp. 195334CR]MBN6035256.1 hypothetical protein [Amycolatopsis sp. 195334CR]
MRVLVPLVFLLAVLTACVGEGKACTLIATRTGVGVEVDPALRAATGTLELCWDNRCKTHDLGLRHGTDGFADVPDLPLTEMSATVRLAGAAGERLVEQSLLMTAAQTFPNGPDCGAGGPQQNLVVEASGAVRVR